jgi:CO/xanthine dehydrogenase Mo-binding subunit
MPLQRPFSILGNPDVHDHSMYMSCTGTLGFTDDQLQGRKWYGAVKTSTIAHGSVKSINAAKALAEPGVKGVWWNDVTGTGAEAVQGPNYLGGFSAAENILSYGQPVAVVVADDWDTARRACALIEVTYNVLPVVYDPDEAVKEGSPLSGRQATSNITTATFNRGGGADFSGAEVTIDAVQPWTNTFQHNPIHPRQGIAWMIGGDLYGQASTQNGMGLRSGLASATGLQLHKVHTYGHTCGGGHGNGGSEAAMQMAGRLTQKLGGHAILVRWSRDNHNTMGSRHYNTKSSLKLGAKKDGTLVACDGDWGDSGRRRSHRQLPLVRLENHLHHPHGASWRGTTIYCNVPRGATGAASGPPGAMLIRRRPRQAGSALDMNPYAAAHEEHRVDPARPGIPQPRTGAANVNLCSSNGLHGFRAMPASGTNPARRPCLMGACTASPSPATRTAMAASAAPAAGTHPHGPRTIPASVIVCRRRRQQGPQTAMAAMS